MKRACISALIFLISSPVAAQQADRIISGYGYTVDGDNLVVAGQEVRLAGIDAPELDQKGEDRINREYPAGFFARDVLASIVADQSLGCRVVPQNGKESDSKGRFYVVCATAQVPDVAGEMVKRGWAIIDRSGETQIYGNYVKNEAEAKAIGRGVWQGPFKEPWLHRVEVSDQSSSANN
ncbi:thermonuclease family protein [Sinorhizobium fredii]|uniref:thermonuclease family protein n=1 Tax=Rhizobium fredii TaxID=380 RepID=UPI0035183404